MDNLDDILKALRDRGVDPGTWGDRSEGRLNMRLLDEQLDVLVKIKDILQEQISLDMGKLSELQDAHARVEKAKSLHKTRGG